jgi:hypothetical protein
MHVVEGVAAGDGEGAVADGAGPAAGPGADDLRAFDAHLRDLTTKLHRKVEDLEDVQVIVALLAEVRSIEADLDASVCPIEEMYALLLR